jgi:hypothetical protein
MENPIKTSGAERTFQSGAHRDANTNKGRYDLLPTRAMREAALHFQHGGQKRGDRNWEQGMPLSQFLDSALRHLFAELEGQTDEPHGRAAAWNVLCYLETKARIEAGLLPRELDDRPKLEPVDNARGEN